MRPLRISRCALSSPYGGTAPDYSQGPLHGRLFILWIPHPGKGQESGALRN